MDIVVTTPKSEIENAAREAQFCIENGSGFYFRNLGRRQPRGLEIGSKIFYVEDGWVRGFAVVSLITEEPQICEVTGKVYGNSTKAVMDAKGWNWIKPIPMKGFQGFRYFKEPYEVVGDWLSPKPEIK